MSCRGIAAAMVAGLLSMPAVAADKGGEGSGIVPIREMAATATAWSGFYVGGHAGYGWGEWNGPLSYDDAALYPALAFDGSNRSIGGNGRLGGLQVGANYQMGAWVAGVEADVSWTQMEGFGSFLPYPDNPGSPAWAIKTKLDMLGTVRGRLGYAAGSLLMYGTAGFAWGRTESSIEPMYGEMSNGFATADHTHIGWTVGGGLEWALGSNWTMRAEYLYIDLGRMNYAYDGETAGGMAYDTDHYHADLAIHTARIGINYKFSN